MKTGTLDWVSLALMCASAVLCALFELMYLPIYIGSVIVPVTILAAVASNLLLPWWGYRTVGRLTGAVLPVLAWLITVLALSLVTRPEGDLFITAAFHQDLAYYGLLLFGATAGFGIVVKLSTPPVRGTSEVARRPRPSPVEPSVPATKRRISR
jgi:hypothetical protein